MGCCESRNGSVSSLKEKLESEVQKGLVLGDLNFLDILEYVQHIKDNECWTLELSDDNLRVESMQGSKFCPNVSVYKIHIELDPVGSPDKVFGAIFDSVPRMKWDDLVSEMEITRSRKYDLCYRKIRCIGIERDFYEKQFTKYFGENLCVVAYSIDGKNDSQCTRAITHFSVSEVHERSLDVILQIDLKTCLLYTSPSPRDS